MTPQEWFAQMEGTMDAVTLACSSMIATHPEKDKVLALLLALTKHAEDVPSDKTETLRYKLGVRTAVATISKGVENAGLADEVRTLKKETGSH